MQNNLEIKTGRTYSAKRPKIIRLPFEGDFYNDRQVIYFDGITVQYDSLEVKPGQNYPKVDGKTVWKPVKTVLKEIKK